MKIEQKIPEGWSFKKLGELFFKSQKKNIEEKNVPVLTNSAVKGVVPQNEYFDREIVSEENLSNYYYVECGDFIYNPRISKTAPAGPIKRNRFTKPGCVSPLYTVFKIASNVSEEFYENYFESNLWAYEAYKVANYGARSDRMNITDKDFFNIKLPFPPLPEQEKIAGILSCWDDGIEKLSALIEKKKIQKKALMQQLLTGKHRLKGFSTPWHEVKLKDVLYEHKETSKGDETICSVSVHKGIISQIEHLGRSFAASNTSNYNLVHYGDVVYTKSPTGEFPYGIFKQSQQRTSVIVSPLYGVFTPKTYYLGYILDVFFSYAINLNNYLKPIIQKGAKNTINITNETFLSKAIFLPEETTEIQKLAEIFIKADEEIELLYKKLEAFKQEKKALMQQLLTGKIRVKVN